MFDRVDKCLEDIQIIKSQGGKVFFHSSDSNHMLDGYLVPDIGPWVKQVIDGAIDSGWEDDDIEELYEKSRYAYMSETPGWVEHKAHRGGGLNLAHLGVILMDEDFISYHGDDIINVKDFSEGITLNDDMVHIEGLGPERGDWISTIDIPVEYEFTGIELKNFLKKYEGGKFYIKNMDSLFEAIHEAYNALFESVYDPMYRQLLNNTEITLFKKFLEELSIYQSNHYGEYNKYRLLNAWHDLPIEIKKLISRKNYRDYYRGDESAYEHPVMSFTGNPKNANYYGRYVIPSTALKSFDGIASTEKIAKLVRKLKLHDEFEIGDDEGEILVFNGKYKSNVTDANGYKIKHRGSQFNPYDNKTEDDYIYPHKNPRT